MRGRDVHVNRAPMDGVVDTVEHEPGENKLAFRKEAEANERLRFEFGDFTLEQIAGAFARRTYSYVQTGQRISRGDRIGHISFSSRFDVVFPPAYDQDDLTVGRGDRVYAGETVIARQRQTAANTPDTERTATTVTQTRPETTETDETIPTVTN